MRAKLFALVAVVGLLGVAVGPGVATAADGDAGNVAANEPLAVTVDQTDGVVVTVTENGTGVANATVNVSVEGNGSYAGTGTYLTDANGTVGLSDPEENVTVNATASADGETASTSVTLVADDGEAESGFGDRVSAFVQSLLDGGETAIGPQVAEFVTSNNPGNAPDHAGPPDHAGGAGDAGAENASANESDGGNGPPAHAGGDDEKDRGNDKSKDKGKDNGGGPPTHAGGADDGDETETDAESDS